MGRRTISAALFFAAIWASTSCSANSGIEGTFIDSTAPANPYANTRMTPAGNEVSGTQVKSQFAIGTSQRTLSGSQIKSPITIK